MKQRKSEKITLQATKELQYKFDHNLTLSPLDLCLNKSLISKETHRHANFFIYLYSIRYGNKRLISHYGYNIKTKLKIINTKTEEQQNKLYKKLSTALIKEQSYNIVRDVCVFSKFPSFLINTNRTQDLKKEKEYALFITGMNTISKFVSPVIKI